jgi:hypothetical protein
MSKVDMYRKELQDLVFIQGLELGPQAKKAVHERMLNLAFSLKEECPP